MASSPHNPQNIWVGKIQQIGPRSFRVFFGEKGTGKHTSRNVSTLADAQKLQESILRGEIPEARRPLELTDKVVELYNSGREVPDIAIELDVSEGYVYQQLKKANVELRPMRRTGCVWLTNRSDIWMVDWWVGDTKYTRTSGTKIKAEAEALKEKWTLEQFVPPPTRIERKKGEGCAWLPNKSKIWQLEWPADGERYGTTSLTDDEHVAESLLDHIVEKQLNFEDATKFIREEAIKRSTPKPCLKCGEAIRPSSTTGLVDRRQKYCDNCPPTRRRSQPKPDVEKTCIDCLRKFFIRPSQWKKDRCEDCQSKYEKKWSALAKAEDRVKKLQEELKAAMEERERLQMEAQGAEAKITFAVDKMIPQFKEWFELPEVKANPKIVGGYGWSHPNIPSWAIPHMRTAIGGRKKDPTWPKTAAIYAVAEEQHRDPEHVKRAYNRHYATS